MHLGQLSVSVIGADQFLGKPVVSVSKIKYILQKFQKKLNPKSQNQFFLEFGISNWDFPNLHFSCQEINFSYQQKTKKPSQ
jgi:hypothetical protein